MRRAVIYARYSTDLQNDQSVEDQIRLCQSHAERLGLRIVGEYHDRAKSGASMFGRPGLSGLMQAADQSAFDVLVSESPDRISRDIADLAHVHKMLKFRDVNINCVNGGAIDTVQVGLYGMVGQMQREESAKKTKRGMVGVIKSGRSAGGRAYGYRPIPGQPGQLAIVDEEAAVIRRIFDLYSGGVSPRSIAALLNGERVPAPRGEKWNASTINGNGQRCNGILRNPVYSGKIVWNRVRMVKDPSTGRRVSRVNDAAENEMTDAPHLRIVDQDLFEYVQLRKEAVGGAHRGKVPRSKRILSGILRCGACGGGMSLVGPDRGGNRIQCSTYRESRSCDHSRRFYIKRIEDHVIDSLRNAFADTSVVEAYIKVYEEEQRSVRSSAFRNRATAQRDLQEAKDAITKVIEKMSKGLIEDDEAVAILTPLRATRDRAKELLETVEEPVNVIELQPKAIRRFRENIEELARILRDNDGEAPPELAAPFRQLVAAVVLEPTEKGKPYVVSIKAFLSSLIGTELSVIKMVAGDRYSLPHLQDNDQLVEVGRWQIALRNVVSDILRKEPPGAANDAAGRSKAG